MANKMFIGGLSWNTTDDGLRSAFSRFGEVVEAKVIADRETGRSRGFGFVTMADSGAMENAIRESDGSVLDGRSIRVNQAEERSGGGGGGGRGGDRPERRGNDRGGQRW